MLIDGEVGTGKSSLLDAVLDLWYKDNGIGGGDGDDEESEKERQGDVTMIHVTAGNPRDMNNPFGCLGVIFTQLLDAEVS